MDVTIREVVDTYGIVAAYFGLLLFSFTLSILTYVIIKGTDRLFSYAMCCAVVAPVIVWGWFKFIGVM